MHTPPRKVRTRNLRCPRICPHQYDTRIVNWIWCGVQYDVCRDSMPSDVFGLTRPCMLNVLKASTFSCSLILSVIENTLYSDASVMKLKGPGRTICEYGLAPAGPGL